MSLAALLFDLDGTVADTEEAHRQAFNAAFIRLGLWWDWGPARYAALLAVSTGIGRLHAYVDSLRESPAEKARLHAIVPSIHAVKSELYAEVLRSGGFPLRPGVRLLVTEARAAGLAVAVVTTSSTANAHAVLRRHFHGEIDLVVCVDEVAKRKPAPDVYLRALSLLRRPAEDCVAFEDSANGLRAAKAAGLVTVVTPTRWTADQDFAGADFLLPDLAGLHLERLQRAHA